MEAELRRTEDPGQRGYAHVFAFVRQQLLDGKLRVGDRLAAERDLAIRLGVSRPVVREVLRALAAFGVIEIRHGYGSVVRKPRFTELGDLFTLMLSQHQDVLDDIMQARIAIERQAIRLAALRATPENLAALEAALQRIEATIHQAEEGAEADYIFHATLVAASGSATLVSLHAAIGELLRRSHLQRRRDAMGTEGLDDYLIAHHRTLLAALVARDPEAADALLMTHFEIGPGGGTTAAGVQSSL